MMNSLADTHEDWDPTRRPNHCSNCLHAKVSGPADKPSVSCALGHSKRRSLPYWSLMRTKHPMGFRTPTECPGWESMSDE